MSDQRTFAIVGASLAGAKAAEAASGNADLVAGSLALVKEVILFFGEMRLYIPVRSRDEIDAMARREKSNLRDLLGLKV